ncbi:MAG: single-stranded DNA-binding protein [Bacteroidales bacterium]|nr:single-stranded DNA-binding protein [Bacteroidales bacterium]
MNLKNRVQLIGNLGSDPQFYEFASGAKMAKISVATSDFFRRDNHTVKETQWHSVIVWGNLADVVKKNIMKGYEVVVDGCLKQNRYKDKNGVEQQSYEVIADTILFSKPIRD